MYQRLADIVLILHASFVVFVVVGLLLIVLGAYRQWAWVRNWWFRVAHLCGIAIVVAQSWIGQICPITKLEMWLRGRAGGAQYEGSFIQYWLGRALYYEAPEWVFVALYTVFGLLVVATWVRCPPQQKPR